LPAPFWEEEAVDESRFQHDGMIADENDVLLAGDFQSLVHITAGARPDGSGRSGKRIHRACPHRPYQAWDRSSYLKEKIFRRVEIIRRGR
jgi:hypothetical protein